jgi:hypothetical protein
MSEVSHLYRCYKQKETRAFNLLFGHSDWTGWSFRKLASLLKHATVDREKISKAFQHAPEIQKAQHRYVVFCYRRLLSSASKPSPRDIGSQPDLNCGNLSDPPDKALESLSPDDVDYASFEESGEHLQDYLFFDIIEKYIDTILHCWQLAREDALSVSTATTGIMSIFSLSSCD